MPPLPSRTSKPTSTTSPTLHKSFPKTEINTDKTEAPVSGNYYPLPTLSACGIGQGRRRAAWRYLCSPSATARSPDPSPSECAPCHHPRTWTPGSTVSSSPQRIYPCATKMEPVTKQPLWSTLARQGHATGSRTPLPSAPQPCSWQLC